MKKTKLLLPCLICASMMIFVACKKGDAGPKGDTGAQGAPGPQGSAGPAGSANVIYSEWTDTTTWNADTVHNGAIIDTIGYFANISAAKLDLDMLNKGEIKVYVNAGTSTDPLVFPLPYNNGALFIDVAFSLNTISLYSNGDLTDIPFRYILIPGGTSARTAKAIDWNDYNAVKAYLGLKD